MQDSLTIVFDFGRVLVDWDPRYLYRKLIPGGDIAVEHFLKEIGFREWNRQLDAGQPLAEAIAELCSLHPQHCALINAYNERWEESIGGPIWPTVEILKELKQAGYPLYGLSNWPAETFYRIRPQYQFFDWFDAIVISGEAGVAKPDLAIYHLLLKKVQRPPQVCLFIDDSPANIDAAQQLGFQTILYTSAEQLRQELQQRGLLAATLSV